MRILGIDPGYGITGFGLIEGERGQFRLLRCGAITTPPHTEFAWRLSVIYNDMVERDKNDATREVAPAIKADDAILLDNTDLTEEETLDAAIRIITEKVSL